MRWCKMQETWNEQLQQKLSLVEDKFLENYSKEEAHKDPDLLW